MAFHPYPQLLRALCHGHRFGPPRGSPPRFSLARGSSPGFGSARRDSPPSSDSLSLRLQVPPPSPRHARPLAGSCSNRHAVTAPAAPTACGRTVSGALSPPSPGSFSPFPHGTLHYRSARVFSLGGVVPPASHRVPRAPWYSRTCPTHTPAVRLRDSHPLRSPLPAAFGSHDGMRGRTAAWPGQAVQPRRRFRAAALWATAVWAPPVSLATTPGIALSSSGY